VINNSAEPSSISLEGIDAAFAGLRVYETSETNDLALTYSGPVSASQMLAPHSITTFVYQYEP
jgi:hypothetical protein